MNEEAFVERRKADWHQLAELTRRAGTSTAALTGAELREYVRLYRRVSTDLAYVRTQSTNVALTEFLNDHVANAYAVLYKAPSQPLQQAIQNAIAESARTVRRRWPFVLFSVGFFFLITVFTFNVLYQVPETRAAIISPEEEGLFDHWRQGSFDIRNADESAGMTGFYLSNNPRVAIIAGAAGAGSFGLFSLYINARTGLQMGALAHDMQRVGKLPFLLTSILPHGVPELSGFWISSAAGLLLGMALINPGRRSRGEALRAVGRDAAILLGTSVVLMFIAAPIEGFFSFSPQIPQEFKLAVGLIEVVGWIAFWTFYGREPESAPQHAPAQ